MNHIYLDLDGVVLLEDDRRNTVVSRTAVGLLQVLRETGWELTDAAVYGL